MKRQMFLLNFYKLFLHKLLPLSNEMRGNDNFGLQKAEERRNCVLKILTHHPIQKSPLKQQFGILKNLLNKNLPRAEFLHFGTITSLNLWFFFKEQKRRKEITKKKKNIQVERGTVLMSFCFCDKALGPKATWGGDGSLQLTLSSHTVHHGGRSRQDLKQKPWRMEDTAY